MTNQLFIAMYHYTRDLEHSRYPQIKGLDTSLFRQQLDFFKDQFCVVRMEQVIDAATNGGTLPENALLLTFDDGYIDNYTFALPLLEEYGFQGSFFIPGKTFMEHRLLDVNKIHYILASEDIKTILPKLFERLNHYRGTEYCFPANEELFSTYAEESRFDNKETIFVKRVLQTALPERVRNKISSDLFRSCVGISEEKLAYELYMTEEQIRTMKRHGMFIGLHGYDHYWLGNLSADEMKADIDKALDAMDPFIDRRAWVMNYPYGDYNDCVLDYVAHKGACIGLTTEVSPAFIGTDHPLKLPRLDCNDFPPKSMKYKDINR